MLWERKNSGCEMSTAFGPVLQGLGAQCGPCGVALVWPGPERGIPAAQREKLNGLNS